MSRPSGSRRLISPPWSRNGFNEKSTVIRFPSARRRVVSKRTNSPSRASRIACDTRSCSSSECAHHGLSRKALPMTSSRRAPTASRAARLASSRVPSASRRPTNWYSWSKIARKTAFALGQGLLGEDPGGDLPEAPAVEVVLPGNRDARDGELDADLLTVLADDRELARAVEDPGLPRAAVLREVTVVLGVVRLGHQDLDVLPDELVFAVPERLLARSVGVVDRAQGVDRQHGIEHSREDRLPDGLRLKGRPLEAVGRGGFRLVHCLRSGAGRAHEGLVQAEPDSEPKT